MHARIQSPRVWKNIQRAPARLRKSISVGVRVSLLPVIHVPMENYNFTDDVVTNKTNTIYSRDIFNIINYNTIQHNTIQHNTIQYCTIPYHTILYYRTIWLYYTVLYYTVLHYTTLYYTMLRYIRASSAHDGSGTGPCGHLAGTTLPQLLLSSSLLFSYDVIMLE